MGQQRQFVVHINQALCSIYIQNVFFFTFRMKLYVLQHLFVEEVLTTYESTLTANLCQYVVEEQYMFHHFDRTQPIVIFGRM